MINGLIPEPKVIGIGILVLGAIVVATGIFGCLSAKKKTPIFTIPFMICTLPLFVILIILGAIAANKSLAAKIKVAGCSAWMTTTGPAGYQETWKMYKDSVGNSCNSICPCNKPLYEGAKSSNKDFDALVLRSTGLTTSAWFA